MKPLQQIALPFAEGEASHAERWNDLVIALHRIGRQCDCQMATFVRWVFNVTSGGTCGELVKSYGKLAERPLGLCCSREKARSTVEQAERLGLVAIRRCRRHDGAQTDNAYTINWEGVRRLKLGAQPIPPQTTGVVPQTTGVACGGINLRNTVFLQSLNSDTGPGAVPEPIVGSNETWRTGNTRHALEADGTGNTPAAANAGELTRALCGQSPILSAAAERRIAPLPAGTLVHGVFAPIKAHHLKRPLRFVTWHRMQLATAVPVMGDNEADLLLTIATALYAAGLPENQVTKSRVGAFVGTICRRKFIRSLPYVPRARTLLDEGIAANGRAWAGLDQEPAEVLQ